MQNARTVDVATICYRLQVGPKDLIIDLYQILSEVNQMYLLSGSNSM